MENVMKNLFLAAAAATTVFAVSPALASAASDAESGYSVYPSAGECHFVKQQEVLPNGHVIFQTHQLCN
jgi:cytochrome c2